MTDIHTQINQANNQITDLHNTRAEDTGHAHEIRDEIAHLTADRNRLIALAHDNYEAGQDPAAIDRYLADAAN